MQRKGYKMALTITEKILARACGCAVKPGDIVNVKVDRLLIMDWLAAIVAKMYEQLDTSKIWDAEGIVLVSDHLAPGHNLKCAEQLKATRDFARKHNIRHFFDIGRNGVGHQIMVERGFVLPGTVAVGTDSHATTYGALGAFSCGVSTSEAAVIMATGHIWFRAPNSVRVNIIGQLPKGISGKDIALKMMGLTNLNGQVLYKAVEVGGSVVRNLPIADRLTICNMIAEMGAKSGIIEPDAATVAYLAAKTEEEFEMVASDEQAEYDDVYTVDVTGMAPQFSCPHSIENVKGIDEVKGTKIHQAYLGSCTNGRIEDLEVASKILAGKKIAPGVRMIIVPASQTIYLEALRKGYIETLVEAGAIFEAPGCGACAGLHTGILAAGETCISSTNRNFKGRMGSPESEVYLASAASVAAAALEGCIADPRDYM